MAKKYHEARATLVLTATAALPVDTASSTASRVTLGKSRSVVVGTEVERPGPLASTPVVELASVAVVVVASVGGGLARRIGSYTALSSKTGMFTRSTYLPPAAASVASRGCRQKKTTQQAS